MVCEASSFQLEDTLRFAPDAGGPAQPRRGPPRPPRHVRGLPRRQARGLRPPAGRARVAVAPAGCWRRGRSAARRERVPFGARRGRPAGATRDGRAVVGRRAADRRRRDPPARRPQPRERDGRRRGVPRPRACRATRCARGCATFAGVAHRLEEVATRDGVLYVNDSKATNVASAIVGIALVRGRRARDPRRQRQGRRLRAARRARRRALPRRLPDRRDRGRARAPRSAATGVPLHECGDLERAVAAARAAARPGDVVLLSPACAVLRPVPPLRGARRRTSARSCALTTHRAAGRRPGRCRMAAPMQSRQKQQPLEHRLLLTATFCLLAGGAVMVYSASSARTLLQGQGDGTAYLVKYVDLRRRSGWWRCTSSSRQGLERVRRYTPRAAGRQLRAAAARAGPRRRRADQRRAPLARRRPAAVPAAPRS